MRDIFTRWVQRAILPAVLLLAGCRAAPSLPPSPTQKPATLPAVTAAPSATFTRTVEPPATATLTGTPTQPPGPTEIPTETLTPTTTFTPTPKVPTASVTMRAFCRYGPGKAYLYSHELKEGDIITLAGRNASGSWLWVQPPNLDRHCWAAASVMQINGDVNVKALAVVQTRLPVANNLYGPPQNIQATRDGDTVRLTWDPVQMTVDDDRGYLIEASICQGGARLNIAVQTDTPSYEFTDEQGCPGNSGGRLYTVEKHGYVDPVSIPWP